MINLYGTNVVLLDYEACPKSKEELGLKPTGIKTFWNM